VTPRRTPTPAPPPPTPDSFFKKEITLGQLIGFIITLVTLMATGWWTISIQTSRNDSRITEIEKTLAESATQTKEEKKEEKAENKAQFQRLNDKLDVLSIKIENKKDR
jgi:hypothetical protein